MTTRRTYNCNLCHDSIPDDSMGVGIKWGGRDAIALTTPGQAEAHICQLCLGALETALKQMRECERKRDWPVCGAA